MQKLKLFIVFLLIAAFVPLAANAESSTPSGVTVKSIKRANDSGNAKELYPATADGQTINLGIKLSNPGDFAKYTLTLNNASDKDFSLDEKSLNHSTDYMSYEFANNAESNVIKAGKDVTITLKALYQNQVPTNKYTNNIFSDTNELILNLNPISETPQNPITSDNILIYLSTFLILVAFAYLAFKKKKYSIFILIAIGVIANVTPIGVHALHTNSITATVTIRIEQPQDAIIPPSENKEAYFLTGSQVNAKMKRLASANISNEEEPSVITTDSNIVAILHSKNEPTSTNKEAKNIVSTEKSPLPIYMWYNNGAIYWWSEDETPNLHQDSEDMFRGASSLTSLDGLKDWNTSNVTDMSSMFEDAKSLTSIDGLENWNTSNVTDMSKMFSGDRSLSDTSAINDWDIRNVASGKFEHMFWDTPTHPDFTKVQGTWSDGTFIPNQN